MEPPKIRLLLLAVGSFVLLAGGLLASFALGGFYAASRATCASHAASLVYFTSIHQALEDKKYDRAEMVAASAVDSHVAVLRQLRASRRGCLTYVLPWGHFGAKFTRGTLAQTRAYFAGHEDQLRPETREFLAAEP